MSLYTNPYMRDTRILDKTQGFKRENSKRKSLGVDILRGSELGCRGKESDIEGKGKQFSIIR